MEDPLFRGKEAKRKFFGLAVILFLILGYQPKYQAKADEGLKNVLKAVAFENFNQEQLKKCLISSAWCQKWEDKSQKNTREVIYQNLLKGYPMEEMASVLAKKEPEIANFLIAIAKKESAWGKHSPQKNGLTCYNYWGYRGEYNQTQSGYSCFDSPEQAVEVVGKRIKELLAQGINTPEKMLVWKCGNSCEGHDPAGVAKWVSDVKSVLLAIKS